MENKKDQIPNLSTPKVRARYTLSEKYNKNAVPLEVKPQNDSFKILFLKFVVDINIDISI